MTGDKCVAQCEKTIAAILLKISGTKVAVNLHEEQLVVVTRPVESQQE